jgi:dodecin
MRFVLGQYDFLYVVRSQANPSLLTVQFSYLSSVQFHKESAMTVARVIEISSTSTKSFEDAIQEGVARATETLRHVTGAWVKEQRLEVENNQIVRYQVNMLVTFILEGAGDPEMS